MNIKIPDSWLREFLETNATPQEIGKYLSLCSQSVEKITKDKNDWIYEIEVTSNRPDCFSVLGIARELCAILPRFNIPASLKYPPVSEIPDITKSLPLNIKITNKDLCPRFTAIIFDNITIKPSPLYVQQRLNQVGIRALNNVIDISNYLMIERGQPMHTFDYDKILKNKMILRESKEGEEIITLDGQKRKLKEGVIVIEDGEKRLIDLCGIMGAKNSETDENTKRVLLFVQTYNPSKIRKACQQLSFRTEAASRFEKGLDPEGVIPAIKRAIYLFSEWCGGKPASKLYDIYPSPQKSKSVILTQEKLNQVMGINFELKEAKTILDNLGFITSLDKNSLKATPPHWRTNDINIPEDLIEEISRIYGYHNLPAVLPPLNLNPSYTKNKTFEYEDKIKICLKYWGFNEIASYSLISEKDIFDKKEKHLKLANPLTEDMVYLRTTLLPGILKTLEKNPQEKQIRIFEIANVYFPTSSSELPDERPKLALAQNDEKFFSLKGILESLFDELGIKKVKFVLSNTHYFLKHEAKILVNNQNVGYIGIIVPFKISQFLLKEPVTFSEIDLQILLGFANENKTYIPIPKYPPIIEHLCFQFPPQTYIQPVIDTIYKISGYIKEVALFDSYQNQKTFQIIYQSQTNNLEDKDISPIRKKIINILKQKFNASLKGQE